MKFKSIFAILFILAIILLSLSIIGRLQESGEDNENVNTDLSEIFTNYEDSATQENQVSDAKIEVATQDGETLYVRDFTGLGEVNELAPGQFHLQGPEVDGVSTYSVLYDANNETYIVALERLPLEESRVAASNDLIYLLDITKEEVCRLNVIVGVPNDLNQEYSGRDLGLSFCPGSVPLQ